MSIHVKSNDVQKQYFIEFLNELTEELFKIGLKEFAGLLFVSYSKAYINSEKAISEKIEEPYYPFSSFKDDIKKEIKFIILRLEHSNKIKKRPDIKIYTPILAICLQCSLEIIRRLSCYCLNIFNDNINRKLMYLQTILKSELYYCKKQNTKFDFNYANNYASDVLYCIHEIFGNRMYTLEKQNNFERLRK